jgi:hypothetical protein
MINERASFAKNVKKIIHGATAEQHTASSANKKGGRSGLPFLQHVIRSY